MSRIALASAWLLSAVSLSLALPSHHTSEQAEGVLSRTILCSLPWLAIAGLPRGSRNRHASVCARWWSFYAYLLPLLILALALDQAAGFEPVALGRSALVVLLVTAVFARAAQAASAKGWSAGYAWSWTILVPLPLVLLALPEWDSAARAQFESVLAATPIGWGLRECLAPIPGSSADPDLGWPWRADLGLALFTALFYFASFLPSRLPGRRERPGGHRVPSRSE